MPASNRRKTVFGADDELLTEFQVQLKRQKLEMSEVIEGWIRDYVGCNKAIPNAPLPTEGTCPLCESSLGITSDGLVLIKAGPIEPMAPGEVPEELMPLMRSIVQYYSQEPIFANLLNVIIADYNSKKK